MFKRKAKEIIRQYPWRYLKLTAIRSVWLWYTIGAEKPPYLFWNLFIYLFMFPGLVLVLLRKHLLSLFAIHIFYFILIHIGINAQFRFICPMMPYGIMIAFYALLEFVRRRNAGGRRANPLAWLRQRWVPAALNPARRCGPSNSRVGPSGTIWVGLISVCVT